MSWEAVGAIAELLSAVGVLATLFYLAHQIKLNTKEIRDSALQSLQEQNMAFLDSDIHTEIGDIFDRANAGEALSPAENAKLRIWFVRGMKLHEQVFLQHQRGRVDDEIFTTYHNRLAREMSSSWAVKYWPWAQHLFLPAFIQYVESLRDEASSA